MPDCIMDCAVNIGFTPDAFITWQGGRDYIRLLLSALCEGLAPEDRVDVLIEPGRDSLGWRLGRLVKRVLAGEASKAWIREEFGHQRKIDLIRDILGQSGYRIHPMRNVDRFDVIGPLLSPPDGNSSVPWAAYIADVQHRILPEMFVPAELLGRDELFQSMLDCASVVIVGAAATKEHLSRHFTVGQCEIVVLPFAANPRAEWFGGEDVRPLYGVDSPYFMCCNQFWKHKNHKVVLAAVAQAKRDGHEFHFVLTGPTEDYRHPEYFEELRREISALGINHLVQILGLIPKRHQIQLMRRAIAVVQPTLFEGQPGGGSIYDAISLGKRTILSNIPVNLEIASIVTEYFDPYSAEDLVRALRIVAALPAQKEDPKALLELGLRRRRQCGATMRRAFAVAAAKKVASPSNGVHQPPKI